MNKLIKVGAISALSLALLTGNTSLPANRSNISGFGSIIVGLEFGLSKAMADCNDPDAPDDCIEVTPASELPEFGTPPITSGGSGSTSGSDDGSASGNGGGSSSSTTDKDEDKDEGEVDENVYKNKEECQNDFDQAYDTCIKTAEAGLLFTGGLCAVLIHPAAVASCIGLMGGKSKHDAAQCYELKTKGAYFCSVIHYP